MVISVSKYLGECNGTFNRKPFSAVCWRVQSSIFSSILIKSGGIEKVRGVCWLMNEITTKRRAIVSANKTADVWIKKCYCVMVTWWLLELQCVFPHHKNARREEVRTQGDILLQNVSPGTFRSPPSAEHDRAQALPPSPPILPTRMWHRICGHVVVINITAISVPAWQYRRFFYFEA